MTGDCVQYSSAIADNGLMTAQSADAEQRQQHRPDIDGLRAIAILSVLGFHAFGRLLPGGFVGVDIFFVISGYLISGILLRGLQQDNFSFSKFYARRVRRIFPALALVLSVTWIAGWYAQLPDEYARLGKHIATGASFISNIALWKEAGYFDQSGQLKPLLHLWSLGVEEQFYLIWPLSLFVAWKRKINLLAMILAVLLASFILNVTRVSAHEASTFYLPTTRFWELLLGAVYAHRQTFRSTLTSRTEPSTFHRLLAKADPTGDLRRNLAASIGLLLIAGSVLCLHSNMMFPGWWAVPPTLGSVLLIVGGPDAWINRHVLASRPMVLIGLISYPLYLWHWPLLSFDIIVAPESATPFVRILLLIVAIALAWLTYQIVERPIRSNPSLIPVALPLAAIVAAIGVVGFLSFRGSIPPRSGNYDLEKIIQAANEVAFPGPELKEIDAAPTPLRRQGKNPKTVLFIGDSFIEQYYPRIDWLLRSNPEGTESVVFASSGGCPPIPKVEEVHHAACVGLVGRAVLFANDPDVNTIVIGANWIGYFVEVDRRYSYYSIDRGQKEELLPGSRGSELALAELQSMITRFIGEGKIVYLVLQSPNDDALDPRQMIGKRWGSASFRINVPLIRRDAMTRPMRPIVSRLRAIAEATGARIIDPIGYLCGTYCPAITSDGVPIYRDEGHLNPSYVRTNIRFFDEVLTQGTPEPP
jgi:peptidoglycan/LPS O-acetylase OafA/YrhL